MGCRPTVAEGCYDDSIMKTPYFLRMQAMMILSLLVTALVIAPPSAGSRYDDPECIELPYAKIVSVQGDTKFIKSKDGPFDYLQYNPTQIGDAITFSVPIKIEDTYRMQVLSYKYLAEGIYRMEIDGQEIGENDFYTTSVWKIGTFPIKPGTYKITFRCVGKNPKSPGIGVRLGNLEFNKGVLVQS